MEKLVFPVQIRWADIDANMHLRHSAYLDYGAMARTMMFATLGVTTETFKEHKIGPILFREEVFFKKEIKLEDKITIDVEVVKVSSNRQRWSMRHHIVKEDGTLAAIINIDGAWMDNIKRKLAEPSDFMKEIFKDSP